MLRMEGGTGPRFPAADRKSSSHHGRTISERRPAPVRQGAGPPAPCRSPDLWEQTMEARQLAVDGAIEFTPRVFRDGRGLFLSPFQEAAFTEAHGRPLFRPA